MTSFLLRRLAGLLVTLLAVSLLIYLVFYVAPGNVAQITCGPRCSPEQVQQVASQLRLDDPLPLRYWHFLEGILAGQDYSTGTGLVHCDAPCLGLSYQSDREVTGLLLEKLPVSLSLALGSTVLCLLLGVGTGLVSAWRRGGITDRLLTVVTLAGAATPAFVSGLILMVLVCGQLRWLPFPQYVAFGEDPEQWFWNLLLPWITVALVDAAVLARVTRASMLETLAEDHVRTFRAYGVRESVLMRRHALRGALAPLIALNATSIGSMVGGAVLTEQLFGIPGLGRELVHAVNTVDLPVVVAVVLVIGVAVVLANAIADVLYVLADRRVALT